MIDLALRATAPKIRAMRRDRFAFLLAAALLTGAISPPAVAQRSGTVVELFTSQGCSSCPPADAFIGELAKRKDVIALSFHVDYWNYLGWKDRFATPETAARQRA